MAVVVWRTRSPDPVDAQMMYWQEAAKVSGDALARAVAYAVVPLVVLAVLVSIAAAWRRRRWDAVFLALLTAPASLVVELLVKEIVRRQRPDGGTALLYPSGHAALATAAAVTVVVVLRATSASPRTRAAVAWLAGWLVLAIGSARLVQTVHYLTDVVGGAALGLAVSCSAVWIIATLGRSRRGRASRGRAAVGPPRHLPGGCDERPSRGPPGRS
ncbi:phosphatase PAP2 family protein [Pseudonocardia kujensis]|uniref:phosphatase PAP2 family protein n=1 Tax=Pseudonocardia kujensis TaxID=1128675 RepID=UPI001E412F11|nr:phosphatase PAP2 family protein [Pseudonocardia kujensis]MCE0763096.1 phosphatase PAP2 family protein [Pseudonocardia kujensis]